MVEELLYCKMFGFHKQKMQDYLRLFELHKFDASLMEDFHDYVIAPNVTKIVAAFYDHLTSHREYRSFIANESQLSSLQQTQRDYLLSLGQNYDQPAYFEQRLYIGVVHHRIGLHLLLYQSAYQRMKELVTAAIPLELSADRARSFSLYAQRILALDMMLATESYSRSGVTALESSIADLKKEGDRLRHWAETDPLTRIANRAHILDTFKQYLKKANADNTPLSIALLDVRNLKAINEKLGHIVGDFVLKKIVDNMSKVLPSTAMLGRYGGDEFLLLVRDTDVGSVKALTDALRRVTEDSPIMVKGRKLEVAIDCGLVHREEGDEIAKMITRAGRALVDVNVTDGSSTQDGNRAIGS